MIAFLSLKASWNGSLYHMPFKIDIKINYIWRNISHILTLTNSIQGLTTWFNVQHPRYFYCQAYANRYQNSIYCKMYKAQRPRNNLFIIFSYLVLNKLQIWMYCLEHQALWRLSRWLFFTMMIYKHLSSHNSPHYGWIAFLTLDFHIVEWIGLDFVVQAISFFSGVPWLSLYFLSSQWSLFHGQTLMPLYGVFEILLTVTEITNV